MGKRANSCNWWIRIHSFIYYICKDYKESFNSILCMMMISIRCFKRKHVEFDMICCLLMLRQFITLFSCQLLLSYSYFYDLEFDDAMQVALVTYRMLESYTSVLLGKYDILFHFFLLLLRYNACTFMFVFTCALKLSKAIQDLFRKYPIHLHHKKIKCPVCMLSC